QVPHAMWLRDGLILERGTARAVVQVKTVGDTQHGIVEAKVSDLNGHDSSRAFALRDPATLTARATRTRAGFVVQALELKTAFLGLIGSGDPEHGVKFTGTLDLDAIEAQFRDLIDFR